MRVFGKRPPCWALAFSCATTLAMAANVFAQDAKLPQSYQASRTIKVAVQNQYPPLNYTSPQTKKLTGFNVDLLAAIGLKLGVTMEMVETSFAQMVPGLDSGRYDFIGTGLGDFPTRRETLTLVDYMTTGPVLITLQGKSSEIKRPADVCGKAVGHVRFVATFATVLKSLSDTECVAKGKPPIVAITDDLPVMLGLLQNRYEAALIATELFPWLQQTEKTAIVRVGEPLRAWLLGLGFRKQDTALRDAVATALDGLVKDGTYQRILDKYKLGELAVKNVSVDAGTF